MSFDTPIDRYGTHCMKWDMMEPLYEVPSEDGLAMWVADMDFPAAPPIQRALEEMTSHGIYGYFGDNSAYLGAIRWWMAERHGWEVNPDHVFTTHGLVNGTGLCVEAFTQPGDAVVLMTPVYHAFGRVIRSAGREVRECPMPVRDGRYEMDFEAWDGLMTGNEEMLVLCSPHNPGGRVWSREELEGVAEFAKRHDLVLVSDEIHHDLTMPGRVHTPMTKIAGIEDRLVMMSATTKTFNIAGAHIGNVIIADDELRRRFAAKMAAFGISPNSFGVRMATAAYSPEGAAWVDDLRAYLQGNAEVFDRGINAIPGLRSMPLEATYLSWVDFSGTGMDAQEAERRVIEQARIAPNKGHTFGSGGESFLRFNIAMPRAQIEEAVERLQKAFADLQ